MEYINLLAFITGLHLHKLPAELIDEIRVMSGDISVVVVPTNHRAPKATPVKESTLAADNADDLVDILTGL